MENNTRHSYSFSHARRIAVIILFALAVISWSFRLSYLIRAMQDASLPINWGTFAFAIISILIFLIPAFLLSFPKNPLSPRRVLVALWLITIGVFWIFGALFQYLAFYDSTHVGFTSLILNYLWIVPIIGAFFIFPVYLYFLSIIRVINRAPAEEYTRADILRKRLAYYPLVASLTIVVLAFVGVILGLTLIYINIQPSFRELVREFINVMNVGFLAGIMIFFVLQPLIQPWLEKFPQNRAKENKILFPLHFKLTGIVISMSFFAFAIYVPVAYKHSQELLGKQLFDRASFALNEFIKDQPALNNISDFVRASSYYAIGSSGYIAIIDTAGNFITPHPEGSQHIREVVRWPDIETQLYEGEETRVLSFFHDVNIIVSRPFQNYRIISVVHESDFLDQLYPLIIKSLILAAIFLVIFTLIATVFIRGIISHLSKLATAAQMMVQHRRPFLITAPTGDEVEVLVNEFTEMAQQLNKYETGLEQKITERTAQLTETNVQLKEKTMILERVLEDVKKVDAELARLNHAKSEFISMASHQLRTPLTAIKWYGKILSNSGIKKLTPTQLRAYHQIISANERMIELVNALLNVSRIEMGTLAIEPQKVEVGKIIENALKDIWPLAVEKEVKLMAGPFAKITAVLDPKFLEIIISNLASNAVRYTTKSGSVTISLSMSGKYVIIKVADTGLGIPKNEQNKIFSKFFRASNVINNEPQGTGLGLYITKSIVEMMNGKIAFSSRENNGTIFTVSLPRTGLKSQPGIKELIPMPLT